MLSSWSTFQVVIQKEHDIPGTERMSKKSRLRKRFQVLLFRTGLKTPTEPSN